MNNNYEPLDEESLMAMPPQDFFTQLDAWINQQPDEHLEMLDRMHERAKDRSLGL